MVELKYWKLICVLILLPIFSNAQEFGGNPSSVKWKQINTAKARIIFPADLDSQANRLYNIMALLNAGTTNTIGNKLRKWNVILQDQTTISNAYVRLAPVISELYMTPDPDNFTNGSIRWDDNLIIHENRHMQQMSNFNNGLTKLFSFFLGQEGQLLANGIAIPNYFFEGDAVWQETLVSAQGRGRMPSFYNGSKSLWLGNKNYSWMKLRSGSLKDYTPDHYELGYQLIAYGYEMYGPDFWRKVTNDAVRFKGLFFAFNKAIERYSQKTYKQFRNDAMKYFKERALPEPSKETDAATYITPQYKNNVTEYFFPHFVSDDTIVITKRSYRELNAFYLLITGREEKIRVKNVVTNDYYSYNNGRIVYVSFQSDPRWAYRNYSVIQLLDIRSKKQKQLSFRSKYFSPEINKAGTEILAVHADPNGHSNLHRINANTGAVILRLPNPNNYYFTQTKYIDSNTAVSAVRDPGGRMALVKVDLVTGNTENISNFSFNVLGYPFVKGDTVYFSAMSGTSDKVFAVSLRTKKIWQLTNNVNGIYHPVLNSKGEMLVAAFTAGGSRLAKIDITKSWKQATALSFTTTPDLYTPEALKKNGSGILYSLEDIKKPVSNYKRSFQLFNFHSWRPVVNDPEYGYTFYSDNVLSSFSNNLTYSYNRNEKSHTAAFTALFAGWYPVFGLSTEASFNRTVDTALGKSFRFNSALLKAVVYTPLSFVGGRTNKYLNIGGGYNVEQLYYRGIGKNILLNRALHYANAFLSFSNQGRQARQHINPRWAQQFSGTYRHAFNYHDSRKFVGNALFYLPGLFINHSLVLQGAFQKRDTLPDLFSNTFSYSRGYDALSTRQMYKLAANYHFPLVYPDWGFANIIFFQRIRANAFYDHTIARARLNGLLTDIVNRSTGAEIFFDTKVWNALPVSFGVRYSRLLDTDLRNPAVKNRWEFIVPIGFIPD
jgi:hypothetical protein